MSGIIFLINNKSSFRYTIILKSYYSCLIIIIHYIFRISFTNHNYFRVIDNESQIHCLKAHISGKISNIEIQRTKLRQIVLCISNIKLAQNTLWIVYFLLITYAICSSNKKKHFKEEF